MPDDSNMLTAALIMDFLAVDENREMVAEVLWPAFFDQSRGRVLPETKDYGKTRWLLNGADITANQAGTQVAAKGESYADRVNVVGGSAYWSNKPESRQLNVSVGAGADCLFDYLVSTCFAALAGFVEGNTYTSASGCTFRGYSTIQGALTAAGALSANDSSTIAICSGTYAESLLRTDVNNASLTLLGTGQGNVIVKPTSGTGPILDIPTQVNGENAVMISGMTFDSVSMSAGSTCVRGGGATRIKMNNCHINASHATDIGITPGNSATNGWQLSQVNFSGAGTGFQTAVSGALPNSTLTLCSFESGLAVGVEIRGQVANVSTCWFGCTIGVQFSGGSAIQAINVTGSTFNGCTTGIKHTSGNAVTDYGYAFSTNTFISCTTGIDLSTLTGNAWGFAVNSNAFVAGTTGIALHATRNLHSVIEGNTFAGYVAGNEISGMTQAQMITANTQVCHNATDSGTPITEYGIGHAGSGSGGAAPNNLTYILGDATGTIASAPNYEVLTGGSGITATPNVGAHTATVLLGNLTADWTQAGVFDISQAGNLIVLKHIALGSTAVLSTLQLLAIKETVASGNTRGINLALTSTTASANALQRVAGLLFGVTLNAASGTQTNAHGVYGSITQQGAAAVTNLDSLFLDSMASIAAAGAIATASAMRVGTAAWSGPIPTTTYLLNGADQGNASVVTAYGLYVPAQTGIASRSYIGDPLVVGGADRAKTAALDLAGDIRLDGVAASGTPAADDLVLYNATGTGFLKVKDPSANVYNLTHLAELVGVVDGTATTQFIPVRITNACTFTAVKCKTQDKKTTSTWRGDIYLVTAGNENTDGGTTSILSAPFGPSGGGMAATGTLSTTTAAGGDWLVFASTTADAAMTGVTMVVEARYT